MLKFNLFCHTKNAFLSANLNTSNVKVQRRTIKILEKGSDNLNTSNVKVQRAFLPGFFLLSHLFKYIQC